MASGFHWLVSTQARTAADHPPRAKSMRAPLTRPGERPSSACDLSARRTAEASMSPVCVEINLHAIAQTPGNLISTQIVAEKNVPGAGVRRRDAGDAEPRS